MDFYEYMNRRNKNKDCNYKHECCCPGPPGPRGPRGCEGPEGPEGPQGPRGPRGFRGRQGEQGDGGLDGATGATGATGGTGATGTRGARGTRGATGETGATGATGATGVNGATIIPFASGITPVELTTVTDSSFATTGLVGFGSAVSDISITGETIKLTGLQNFAFMVPRDGVITSIAGFFSITERINIRGSVLTIRARLFSAHPNNNDNIFEPITEATVDLSPTLTGLVRVGHNSSGINKGLSIPVTAGQRLLLVFSVAVTSGDTLAAKIIGMASGGVSII